MQRVKTHITGVISGCCGQDSSQELCPYRTFVMHPQIAEKDFGTWIPLSLVPVHVKKAV